MYKPYTCELSKTKPGVEILYKEVELMFVPIQQTHTGKPLHQVITDALNGAYSEGGRDEKLKK